MSTSCQSPTRAKANETGRAPAVAVQRHDIPYFAHQQLDPARFPYSLGMPIARAGQSPVSPSGSNDAHRDWNDDEIVMHEEPFSGDDHPTILKHRLSTPAHMDSASYKKMKMSGRMSGGRPAVAKKVTAELDSDDDLLVRMKNAKYQEKEIAQRLQDEGRILYNPKTIGTRWARLKKVLQKQQDEMLDAELSDWHEGDDDVLGKAVEEAEAEVEKLKAAADAKMWRIVADKMKAMKPVTNFSQNACRDRYDALKTGTAKIPPELTKNVTEKTEASVQSRKDREAKIAADREVGTFGGFEAQNLEKNAWTSRARKYF